MGGSASTGGEGCSPGPVGTGHFEAVQRGQEFLVGEVDEGDIHPDLAEHGSVPGAPDPIGVGHVERVGRSRLLAGLRIDQVQTLAGRRLGWPELPLEGGCSVLHDDVALRESSLSLQSNLDSIPDHEEVERAFPGVDHAVGELDAHPDGCLRVLASGPVGTQEPVAVLGRLGILDEASGARGDFSVEHPGHPVPADTVERLSEWRPSFLRDVVLEGLLTSVIGHVWCGDGGGCRGCGLSGGGTFLAGAAGCQSGRRHDDGRSGQNAAKRSTHVILSVVIGSWS